MYARLINESRIEYAPKFLVIGRTSYVNPTPREYADAGYYEVIDNFNMETYINPQTGQTEYRETPAPKWYHYEDRYEIIISEINTIRHTHVAVKDARPDYGKEISKRIRSQYSQSDVEAIILNNDESNPTEEHVKELQTLLAFRQEVKAQVKADIAEWEKA